jgi:hypothetical protein
MRDSLVGYTGFVGSNLVLQHNFKAVYNSANISESYGTHPDLLVYAGVRAEMFLANGNPQADLAMMWEAAENIRKIAPGRLVLISTIAVVSHPIGADEDTPVDVTALPAYGANRYRLEQLAEKIVEHCHIIRLPALFGRNLKKNFIHDLIHFVPPMLDGAKYRAFGAREELIASCYKPQSNGFYGLNRAEFLREDLKAAFKRIGFSALNFTDSRSVFQFYNLAHLWGHIQEVVRNGVALFHPATAPLSAAEVYKTVKDEDFVNELPSAPKCFDCRTKYDALFGGKDGYIFNRTQVLDEIRQFVETDRPAM